MRQIKAIPAASGSGGSGGEGARCLAGVQGTGEEGLSSVEALISKDGSGIASWNISHK